MVTEIERERESDGSDLRRILARYTLPNALHNPKQVSVEERLSQNESRVLAEARKQFDLELAELRERIDAVHKVRTACRK